MPNWPCSVGANKTFINSRFAMGCKFSMGRRQSMDGDYLAGVVVFGQD
jgi:hypothetical protein